MLPLNKPLDFYLSPRRVFTIWEKEQREIIFICGKKIT